ncbi:MAG: hypothetical protein Q9219_002802 [cf. Caloplaca sp. 3 TL-2023]
MLGLTGTRYVEMLEQQQAQLVNALQELYKRITNNEGWEGDILDNSLNGHPLTHDILERLGALRIDGHPSPGRFEENTDVLQQKLLADGAVHIKRQLSPDSDSDDEDVPPRKIHSPAKKSFTDSFLPRTNQLPLTPPVHTPSTFITDSPTTYTPTDSILTDSTRMQIPQQIWSQSTITYEPSLDFYAPQIYDQSGQLQHQSNPCLPIPAWIDDDIGNLAYCSLDPKYSTRV